MRKGGVTVGILRPRPPSSRAVPFLVAWSLSIASDPAGPVDAQDLLPSPDTIIRLVDGPEIFLFPAEATGVAAIRVFVPVTEHPVERGAGAVVAELAERRMRGAVGSTGADVSATRSPWGISYSVEGAEIDLDFLGFLIRTGVAAPSPGDGNLPEILVLSREEASRREESPEEYLVARLLTELGVTTASAAGELRFARIRELWARTHVPGSMAVFVHTSAEPAVVLAALGILGNRDPPPAGLDDLPHPSIAASGRPSTIRRWHGSVWADRSPADPRAEVLVRLIAARMNSGPDESVMAVRLLTLADRSAIVVTGAAYPRGANTVRELLRGIVDRVRETLTEQEVREAAREAALERWTRLDRPAAVLRAITDAYGTTGELAAASERLRQLESLGLAEMLEYVETLDGPRYADLGR